MPAPIKADWRTAQTLIMQGLAISQVAKDMNLNYTTLWRRAKRHGWLEVRDRLDRACPDTLLDRGVEWRKRACVAADRMLDAFSKLPDKRVQAVARPDVQSLRDLVETGMRVYGLDRDQDSISICLNVRPTLSQTGAGCTSTGIDSAQVVDVQAEEVTANQLPPDTVQEEPGKGSVIDQPVAEPDPGTPLLGA